MTAGSDEPDERPEPAEQPEPTDDEVDRRFAELTSAIQVGPPAPGPRDYAPPEDPEEPFEPPEPEPLDGVEPLTLAAWFAAVGGPLVGIVLLVVWPAAPALLWWTLLGLTLGGWAVVIWRLPRSRDSDDDGARV